MDTAGFDSRRSPHQLEEPMIIAKWKTPDAFATAHCWPVRHGTLHIREGWDGTWSMCNRVDLGRQDWTYVGQFATADKALECAKRQANWEIISTENVDSE